MTDEGFLLMVSSLIIFTSFFLFCVFKLAKSDKE